MKITPEIIRENIFDYRFYVDGVLTICVLEMRNGFKFVGHSACADPAEYSQTVGEKLAYDDAFRQTWSHMGFMLRDRIARSEA
jgi:hypothetical protein